MFNSYHTKLRFTVENANNNHISFQDITIIFNGYFFSTSWYRKFKWSGTYLNLLSYTYNKNKVSVINSISD